VDQLNNLIKSITLGDCIVETNQAISPIHSRIWTVQWLAKVILCSVNSCAKITFLDWMTHWWGYSKYEHVYYRKLLSPRLKVENEYTIYKLSHHRNHGEGDKIGVHRIWVKSTADQLSNLEYTTHKLSHHRNHGEGKIGVHRIWVKSTADQLSNLEFDLGRKSTTLLL
jgi:hypothetical protein